MRITPAAKLLHMLGIPAVLFSRPVMVILTGILLLVLTSGCSLFERGGPDGGSPEIHAEKDVISTMDGVSNLDKLDTFLERGSGSQRVVHYTIEGDPIFMDLRYEGGQLELRYDTTLDAFGSGKVETMICNELVRTEEDQQLKYILQACGDQGDRGVLILDFDLERQDKFEFVLKYGVNHRNVIDTVNQSLVKDMLNGTTLEVSDYSMTQADRQSIYRKLVLAGYLEEKQLSTSCNRKPYESFELTVLINTAERHYAWSECDTSRDGTAMMEVADYIIGLVQTGDVYQQLPAATGGYK